MLIQFLFLNLIITFYSIFAEFFNKKFPVSNKEFDIFKQRLEHLKEHVQKLNFYYQNNKQIANKLVMDRLQNCCKELNVLRQQVEQMGSLNTGGCFEWVDSKIINSLRDGHYIVLEHVNLSSAAIVDRLNSAFEKDGKLLISERGAISTNSIDVNNASKNNYCNINEPGACTNRIQQQTSMMIVERAKNFQAFLTINPKYGQLSRAMRNRCIELSLSLNMDNYDWNDKRSLIYSNGIKEIGIINVLIRLHEDINKLTEHNNYNVTHLIQMAQLMVNYKKIAYSNERAIYESAMEIYINSANIDYLGYGLTYYHERLHDIVIEAVENVNKLNCVSNMELKCDYLDELTLRCNDLNAISMINMQLVPLKILLDTGLNNYHLILTKYLSRIEEVDTLKITTVTTDKLNDLAIYYVHLLYTTSTMKDVELRNRILSKLFAEKKETLLEEYSKKFYECIKYFQFKEDGENLGFCAELPWNYKLFPRLRDYQKADKKTPFLYELNAKLIINLAMKEIPIYQKSIESLNLKQITALAYSQAIINGHITDIVNNDFIRAISKFLYNLSIFIKNQLHLEQNQNINKYNETGDDKFLLDLFIGMSWFNRFVAATDQQLFTSNNTIDKNCINKIWLHFKWMKKHFLDKLHHIKNNFFIKNSNFSEQWQVLNQIEGNMEIANHEQIVKKLYTKNFVHFQAFFQEKQVFI